ncbi:MAG: hypothetical protein ACRD88_03810 [Terriglobia bacterium]
MRPTGTPEELQRRRLRAIELLRQGYAPVEVAPDGRCGAAQCPSLERHVSPAVTACHVQ